jgi:hypothetical protein
MNRSILKSPSRRHQLRYCGVLIAVSCIVLSAAARQKFAETPSGTQVTYASHALQGFDLKVWISNQMAIGLEAWDCLTGACIPEEPHVGVEYPAGSGIEHVFGGGPWIGGIINGSRRVTQGYDGNTAQKYLRPDPRHPLRERIWRTSVGDSLSEPNRRGCDDDGDGLIDEDDLDGLDNDGDWVEATDDVGADGVADLNETGCRGGYDAEANPDPAGDDYDPVSTDSCHPDAGGNYRTKDDPDAYTEKNGIPDHGEPHVDEDYAALSDNDLYCSARDDNDTVPGHFPMGIRVVQKCYAWKDPAYGAIIPFEYSFINAGTGTIRDVYISYFMDADVGPGGLPGYVNHNYSCFIDTLLTAYVDNPVDRGSTPIGLTVLGTPKPLNELKFIWRWFNFTTQPIPGTDDSTIYSWMSGQVFPDQPVATCQSPTDPTDTRFFLSFGPFETFAPGETLKVTFALVSGSGVESGPDNLKENAQLAKTLYQRTQYPGAVPVRVSPPSPPLRFTRGERQVQLDWGAGDGADGRNDPRLFWDLASRYAETFPDGHWRRVNPPCTPAGDPSGCSAPVCDSAGRLPGGRIFEGYRVYRSEDQGATPDPGSFTLIRDFDDSTDGIGFDVGLDTVFVDSGLQVSRRYWYAVTSYGIPEMTIIGRPLPSGGLIYDTLLSPGYESDVRENMVRVDLTFLASDHPGEVKVVPNPYRVDADYTTQGGGWEGNAMDWTDFNRKVRFIHLPAKCTIRICTVAGEIVATLHYESPPGDPQEGYLDWRLVTGSKRPLASGIYVYAVESEVGTQYGTFVVIR